MSKDLFTKEITVFWPEKYDPIVELDWYRKCTHVSPLDGMVRSAYGDAADKGRDKL